MFETVVVFGSNFFLIIIAVDFMENVLRDDFAWANVVATNYNNCIECSF